MKRRRTRCISSTFGGCHITPLCKCRITRLLSMASDAPSPATCARCIHLEKSIKAWEGLFTDVLERNAVLNKEREEEVRDLRRRNLDLFDKLEKAWEKKLGEKTGKKEDDEPCCLPHEKEGLWRK